MLKPPVRASTKLPSTVYCKAVIFEFDLDQFRLWHRALQHHNTLPSNLSLKKLLACKCPCRDAIKALGAEQSCPCITLGKTCILIHV